MERNIAVLPFLEDLVVPAALLNSVGENTVVVESLAEQILVIPCLHSDIFEDIGRMSDFLQDLAAAALPETLEFFRDFLFSVAGLFGGEVPCVEDIGQTGCVNIADRNTDLVAVLIFRYLLIQDGVLQLLKYDAAEVVLYDHVSAFLQIIVDGEIDISSVPGLIALLRRGDFRVVDRHVSDTADVVDIEGLLTADRVQDCFLGGLYAGQADHVALVIKGMSLFIGPGMLLFLQIALIRFTGITDNIAEINDAVCISADEFFFDLNAVRGGIEARLDGLFGLLGHVLGEHGGNIFLIII